MLLSSKLEKKRQKELILKKRLRRYLLIAELRPQFPFSLFTIEIAFRKKKAKQKQKEASAAAVYL